MIGAWRTKLECSMWSVLGGRDFGYYPEDPLLSGVLGTAYVRAFQAGVGWPSIARGCSTSMTSAAGTRSS